MKFLLTLASVGFIFLMILAGGSTAWFFHEFHKAGPAEETILINIKQGSSLSAISRDLSKEGIIQGEYAPLLFKLGTRIKGAGYSLKAGEYEIPAGASMSHIMKMMHEGRTFQRFATIPEGLTSFEIVRLLNSAENLTGEISVVPKEGTLLPDSYSHSRDEPRTDILNRMAKAMSDLKVSLSQPETMPPSVITLCDLKDETEITEDCWDKVITLASIVEKETGHPEEREQVAGVFLNRLKRGIALQTDPTVIYAITKGAHKNGGKGPLGRRLLTKDLEFDSPYNTYLYPGLPPGPIANPGKASIEAVLNPADHDYIYFVANGTGGHAFARTLEEHNRNVAKWRKIRRKSGN